MTEFGFNEQPVMADVTVGTYQCKLASFNDTVITCNAASSLVLGGGCFYSHAQLMEFSMRR